MDRFSAPFEVFASPEQDGTLHAVGPSGVVDLAALDSPVRALHRAFAHALAERIASHGVSVPQWLFLRALSAQEGPTQRELSQRVGMMEPTTATTLNALERRGLVIRVCNSHDRRKVNIHLTPAGRTLHDELLPCSAEVQELATRGIDRRDLTAALAVLAQIAANLAATPETD
ncbi:MAG: MarR family transcriptional regulator [Azospirillum sp.]|nr:MarR family transcriptional regulator [Azospirillum sp.]